MGHGVEMGGEHHPPVALARDAGDQVAGPCLCRPRGAVLGDLHPKLAKLGQDGVGNRPLGPGRAGHLAQPHEAIQHPLIWRHSDRLCARSLA